MNISIVIASGNNGKVKEFRELLADLPLNVLSQPEGCEVAESGTNFIENARLKALAVSHLTGQWALADDSGLAVEALNGLPGIYSARYADTDIARINKLLKELAPFNNRNATFTSALCVAVKGKVLLEVEANCKGLITKSPRGKDGFGYDPIFEVSGLGMTFAEMGVERKKIFGHRGRAFQLLKPKLKEVLGLN